MFPIESVWRMYEKNNTKYSGTKTEYVDTVALPSYAKQGIHFYKKTDVQQTVSHSYEFIDLNIPKGNDTCLRQDVYKRQAEGKECNASKHSAKGHYEKVKIVRFSLKPNREKMAMRMCLSEHPFGTIKRAMGATYFLLRGLRKVTGEFALLCLGYNIERAKNLLGFEKMMEIIAGV